MRARSGGTPSSSSSRMVRRYISVVSTRSFTVWPPSSDNTSLPGVDSRPEPVHTTLPDRPWEHVGMVDRTTSVVWDSALLDYDMGAHPLNPVRIELTMALARSLGVLDRPGVQMITPKPAT